MSFSEQPDDLEVIRAQKDDAKSIESLLKKTSPYILTLCKTWCRPPIDPEDVAQESLMRVAKNLKSFQHGSAFFSWVYTLTYRTFLDSARKESRRSNIAQIVPLDSQNDDIGSDNAANSWSSEQSEAADALASALESLDSPQREILILIDVQELSYEQASIALGIPVGTVRSRLARSRLKLRNLLINQGTISDAGIVISSEETK